MHIGLEALDPGGPLHLPDGAGWFTRLKVAMRALAVLAENKADGIAAPVLNASIDSEVFERLVREFAETEEGRALLVERPNLQAGSLDLSALRSLPDGTLGYQLAAYYRDNGIEPFESPYPIRSDVEYLAKRYREIHDVVHVVTGYGTDPLSEMELQAFILGNIGFRLPVVILSFAGVMRTDGLPPIWTYFDKLRAAYARGRRSRDVVLSPRYERYWAMRVEDVRSQLGLAA